MATRLIKLKIPMEMTADKARTILSKVAVAARTNDFNFFGEIEEEIFNNGGTYPLVIPESTVNYTLSLDLDGRGQLQRTTGASEGSRHASYTFRERALQISPPEGKQESQIYDLSDEQLIMPMTVGHKEGIRLQAIFIHDGFPT